MQISCIGDPNSKTKARNAPSTHSKLLINYFEILRVRENFFTPSNMAKKKEPLFSAARTTATASKPPGAPAPNPLSPAVFIRLESDMAIKFGPKLTCPNCSVAGNMTSKGACGDTLAKGVRRISVHCKACASSCRLEKAMECSGFIPDLKRLRAAYLSLPTVGKLKYSEPAAKKRREAEPGSEPSIASDEEEEKEEDEEEDQEMTEQNDSGTVDITAEMMRLREENANLCGENHRLHAENQRLQQALDACQATLLTHEDRLGNVEALLHQLAEAGNAPAHQATPAELTATMGSASDERAPTGQGNTSTYAAVTRKNPASKPKQPLKKRQAILTWARTAPAPQEFHRLHIKVRKGRGGPLGQRQLLAQGYQLLKTVGIRSKVKEISFIGQSVLQLYVAGVCLPAVKDALGNHQIEIQEEFDPWDMPTFSDPAIVEEKMVNRLAILMRRNTIKNMRIMILQGCPARLEALVMERMQVLGEALRTRDRMAAELAAMTEQARVHLGVLTEEEEAAKLAADLQQLADDAAQVEAEDRMIVDSEAAAELTQ